MNLKGIIDKSTKAVRLASDNGMDYMKNRIELNRRLKKDPKMHISYSEFCRLKEPTEKMIKRQEELYRYRSDNAPRFVVFIESEDGLQEQKDKTQGSIVMQTYMPEKVFIGKKENISERISTYLEGKDITNIWIVRIAAGATFEITYFSELSQAILSQPDIKIWYTDHDVRDAECKNIDDAAHYYKPDYSLDFLCSFNYIGDVFAVNAATYGEKFEQLSMDSYEFLLVKAKEQVLVGHVPTLGYSLMTGVASEKNSEKAEKEKQLIADIWKSLYGDNLLSAKVYETKASTYKTELEWKNKASVSVIIPTKDHCDDLCTALRSLAKQTIFDELEILVVENNSESEETFDYYSWLLGEKDECIADDAILDYSLREKLKGHIKLLYWNEGFNFSAINNYAASKAMGDYILLMNNDIELKSENTLELMLNTALRPDVGMVGAKLYFQDDTIQHAGVVVGLGGVAGHAFLGFSKDDEGYLHSINVARRVSAVTAACMMVRKSIYMEVEGLEEGYAVDFNDVDFCLKVAQKAMIIYQPLCEAYHYESKTRGNDKQTKEQVERFRGEINLFLGRWKEFLKKGDPYYNKNLTLALNDYSIGSPFQMD